MKGKKDNFKKGGEVKAKDHEKHEEKKHEKKGEKHEKKEEKKEEHKKPHLATGGGVKARLDKPSRGKKSTPGSPLSGAMPSGLPGVGKGVNAPVDKERD